MAPVAMVIAGGGRQYSKWRRSPSARRGAERQCSKRRRLPARLFPVPAAGLRRRSRRRRRRVRGSRGRVAVSRGPIADSGADRGSRGPGRGSRGRRSHVGHLELHPGAQEAAGLAAGAAAAAAEDGAAGPCPPGPAPHGQPRPLSGQPRPRRPPRPIRSLGRRGPAPRPRPGAAAPAAIGRRGAAAAGRLRRHLSLHRQRRGARAAARGGEFAGEIRGAGADRNQAGAAPGRRRHRRHLRRPLQAGGHDGRRGGKRRAPAQKRQEAARRRGGGGGQGGGQDGGGEGGGQEVEEAGERGGSGDREPAEPAVHQGAAEQEGEPGDPGAAEHDHGQGAVHRGEVPLARARAGAGVLRPRHQGGVRARQRRRAALRPPALPAHHQQAHGRVAGRLLVPQHVLPHGHLQVRALRDRRAAALAAPRGPARPAQPPPARPARRRRRRPPLPPAVDLLRHPVPGRADPGQVRRGHGRPALGHPHGAALRDADGRRDAAPQHPRAAGRGLPLPLGHRQGHGAGPRMPQPLGLRARGRDNLGENQPAAAHHPHRPHRPLAQPRQGALPGGGEGEPPGLQPRPGLRRHRGRGSLHQPQTRRNLRDDRAALAGDAENRTFRAAPQRPAQLDHSGEPAGRDPPAGPRRGRPVQATLSRRRHLQTQKHVVVLR